MLRKAKYVLDKNIRVHLGSRSEAYKCIWYGPDAEGNNGIYLGKDVVNEASRALSLAMFKVAPSILTYSQIAKYAATEIKRRLSSGKVAPYKPRFTECLDHFLIHAGEMSRSDGQQGLYHAGLVALTGRLGLGGPRWVCCTYLQCCSALGPCAVACSAQEVWYLAGMCR